MLGIAIVFLLYVAGMFIMLDTIIGAGLRRQARRDAVLRALPAIGRDAGTFRGRNLRPMPRGTARLVRAGYLRHEEERRDALDDRLYIQNTM